MTTWNELAGELERRLRLRTFPVAYKRLEKVVELDAIPKVRRLDRFFTFCQLPALVRTRGWTVGVTVSDNMSARCTRIHGLAATNAEAMAEESASLATTWFSTAEEAMKQQVVYPRIPPGEAIVLAPLASGKFDPDVVLVYGNPAQAMFILNALQWKDYERFHFSFIGEGACADSLAQCFVSGKPSLAIPCFGERRFGEVMDEELVLALPPQMVEKAVLGLEKLSRVGLRFPIPLHGAECDPLPALTRAYPDSAKRRRAAKDAG